ncbi:MAG: CoA transferase [Acidimicrobiia bacterium]|nr:CoA transferase [Acidimicrobiia bacterium]
MPAGTGPAALEHLRVIDFSRVLAGPLATMILGDLGADIIKVEHPGRGDETRAWGPPFHNGNSTYYLGLNRNKRSIALDLKDPVGRAQARQLCGTADVVVDNFRPGWMASWGLDRASLAVDHPEIITCSITGFGSTGPGADLAGYDFLVQAMSGLMSITGEIEGDPMKAGVALVDKIAGLYATVAILAAVESRRETGSGQHVEVSLMGAALAGLLNVGSGYVTTGQPPRRHGNRHPSIAPYQIYRSADGLFALAAASQLLWTSLCAELGRPDLIDDPRFTTNAGRVEHVIELEGELNAVFETRPTADWIGRLRARGVPIGPINTVAAAFEAATEQGLDPVVAFDCEGAEFRSVRSPIGMSETPPTVRRRPPDLDQHRGEIIDGG